MEQILSELIAAILQILVFTLIPFIFFLLRNDKAVSFRQYIGLIRPPAGAMAIGIGATLLIVASGVGITLFNESWRQAALSPDSVTGKLRLMGPNLQSALVLLIIAWLKTSLSEEILFRGFLAKQLIGKFGFQIGNLLQSLIFGLVHLLLFGLVVRVAAVPLIMIFVFSTSAGWIIGLIKYKHARGSIIPGWIAHALGNTISYAVIAYVL